MQRNPAELVDREYDVLVIGAGAFGAAAARDAALRGLRTALIERADFGGATSADCFKMVHGGIRYLQHADVPRMRASCYERSALLRIAPHLVHPLPIAIPTYGHGRRGRAFLAAGTCAYDLLTLDRNTGIQDPQRQIKRSRFLSRAQLLELFPHLQARDLSGAVVFEDGQMYSPARLVLAFVSSAVTAGATACNYVEATKFLWQAAAVCGVRARDRLSGEEFDVRAKLTLNAAGPWADYLQNDPHRFGPWQRGPFSRDAYFVVDRAPTSRYGVAVQGLSRDKDAVLGRATRHLFAVPWHDKTLIGVWHRLFPELPDTAQVQPHELDAWVAELNAVYPALQLSAAEVSFAHCGLVPFGDTATQTELSFGKESRLVDHRAAHGVSGLVSLIGIRFTTARADASRALDLLLRQFSHARPDAGTSRLPLTGGDIEDFAAFQARALQAKPAGLDTRSLQALLRNHGTAYERVLRPRDSHAATSNEDVATNIPDTTTLLVEIRYAVEHEMAVKLDDLVMRRTEMAAGSHPGQRALATAALEMARHLRWSQARTREELAATERTLARHLARVTSPSVATTAVAAKAVHGAMLADGLETKRLANAITHPLEAGRI
jgi:glycerol-3-phosphate dehydrogenase